jgi:hypothetical protein
MSYQKIMVDNKTCSRRFHVTFDDESKAMAQTEVKCPHCNVVVWSAQNHPEAKLARDENLVKTTQLSRNIVSECHFHDGFKGPKA